VRNEAPVIRKVETEVSAFFVSGLM